MKVCVSYALPDVQLVRELDLGSGATVRDALEQSGLLTEFPEIDTLSQPVGIFGQVVPDGTVLQHGDRVEIYRSLRLEPKQARLKRARKR
jgi:uncharacterized protein